ncbi:uncharacterized protein LOC117338925 [Pecten maximus]|uniref:uncharacterized protein LOC117338925 n=1 Tax=Pecten maximus TaxID=6579 RepID=UPI0014583BD4|nr:uncharacterized protein LOC117338925 [Pecten maximus]
MAAWEDYLRDIYFNPSKPASLSGPDKVYRFVKKEGKFNISKYKTRKWLQRHEAYSLQRPNRKPANRSHINVAGIDDQWSADLIDMVKFSKYNDEFSYVLVVIDVFSKFLWLRGDSVAIAFKDIFTQGRHPSRIRTDKGQEFRAKVVQSLFRTRDIRHMYAQSEVKAAVSERVLKTVKTKLYRYFTYKQSYRYIDQLQSFVDGYNQTIHNTIDIAPADVTVDNAETVRLDTYLSRHTKNTIPNKKMRFRFNVGDSVRITYLRNIFTREYDERWTGEIFTIAKRFWRQSVPIYRLKDYNDVEITGSFYQSELQKVDLRDDDMWKIEKVLKTRGKGRNKQLYVKWLHWPIKFSSWINANDAVDA